ncbi:uncharacterized protein KNAG_0I02580 [Huiozyma naganishii CBS 8797]|uniref:DUF1682-domain-containing protein n=1 Tax=Huiozyma naganishii (strain ATCC MYA-139 / BCRC 22969 / CBS 8797 / KCTC 17520 / NBRC 10181 / NCYC 3082 / Yp74L-3) TaxID=1071383 RepID=J7RQI6_HUIN7|nr:hypothetical protein KNAG_0I02580 [Kazachstania naganishii CBS 8797]CCK72043.1 hypothetical protein KNAG_0I02580 [Kazachstania naganishii CBS 8797]
MSALLGPLTSFMETVNSLNANYNALSYEELTAMGFVQRLKLYNWTFEMFSVGIVLFMFITYRIGVSMNLSRADKFFDSIHAVLKNNLGFSRVGLATSDPNGRKMYLDQHLHTWFTTFATGRSSISSVNVQLHLFGRNNPVNLSIDFLIGFFLPSLKFDHLEEYCEVILQPNGVYVGSDEAKVNGNANELLGNFKFTTSIVNKSVMTEVRNKNYFLSLTHVTENDKLPREYAFMSETNQLNDFIYKYAKPTFNEEVLAKVTHLLEFISFTDLPAQKPETEQEWNSKQQPRCVIRCKVPTSKKDLKLVNDVVVAAVEVFDNFTKDLVQKSSTVFITPDMLKKTKATRQQELSKIVKNAKKIAAEKALEDKKEAEKEKRRELKKSGNLEKSDQKMKEKRERRLRNKQRTRMQ